NLAGPNARDHHRDLERTYAGWSSLLEDGVRLLDLFQSTDRAAHDHTDLVTIGLRNVKSGLLERLFGGHHRELHEARHPASFLAIKTRLGFEVNDLACHLAGRGWW